MKLIYPQCIMTNTKRAQELEIINHYIIIYSRQLGHYHSLFAPDRVQYDEHRTDFGERIF